MVENCNILKKPVDLQEKGILYYKIVYSLSFYHELLRFFLLSFEFFTTWVFSKCQILKPELKVISDQINKLVDVWYVSARIDLKLFSWIVVIWISFLEEMTQAFVQTATQANTLHLELWSIMCNRADENQAHFCDPYGLRVQKQLSFLVCSSITILTSVGLGPLE